MAFGSREEYEARRRVKPVSDAVPQSPGVAAPAARSAGPRSVGQADRSDVELRMSPLYGAIVLLAGLTFCVLAVLPQNRGGRNFRIFCAVTGAGAVAGGILLLRRRGVVVRMTATELHLPGAAIPWGEIRDIRRARSYRSYWIGIYLKNPRTDLTGVQRRARAMLAASQSPLADADYAILETDLPRSGLWFLEECRRRMES
jgi:hypothetical protein